MDYTIKIGGEAGQGIQTIGEALGRVFVRAGYHVFTHQDYESRIRGGHNFYQLRLTERPVFASRQPVDILVAFDSETIRRHAGEVEAHGRIVYDSETVTARGEGGVYLGLPLRRLAVEQGGDTIMANIVATGAVLGLLDLGLDLFLALLAETFHDKGEQVIAANVRAARAGASFAREQGTSAGFQVAPVAGTPRRMLIAGIEAIALGALASGCRFYAAYPMTPSTGIMNYLAAKAMEHGLVVEQAEDEIAAINMALGASYAGLRAMTGTSGGGFALMTEGLSLSGMTETPIVIAMGQRPGPATGLPTRTEQGDLEFLVSAGHGEFPRLIFAPGSPRQAFHLTNKAFELAEKYQIPAFILFDTYLADAQWTLDSLDLDQVRYHDYRLRGEAFGSRLDYRRYAFTASGISPLAVPGEAEPTVVVDSDEHDEDGHIVEDAATRVAMVDKRLRRRRLLKAEIAAPEYYGPPEAGVVLVGWGSTYGVMREAVDALLAASESIAMLHFSELYPLPATTAFDYLGLLRRARLAVCLEHNAGGQFARLLRAETGFSFTAAIRRYDGRPFTVEELLGEIHAHFRNL